MCREPGCFGGIGIPGLSGDSRGGHLPFDLTQLHFHAACRYEWDVNKVGAEATEELLETHPALAPFDNGEGLFVLGDNEHVAMSEFIEAGIEALKADGIDEPTDQQAFAQASADLASVLKGTDQKFGLWYVGHVLDPDVASVFLSHGGMEAFAASLPTLVYLKKGAMAIPLEDGQGLVLECPASAPDSCAEASFPDGGPYLYEPATGTAQAYDVDPLMMAATGIEAVACVNPMFLEQALPNALTDMIEFLDQDGDPVQAWQLFFLRQLLNLKAGEKPPSCSHH